MDDLVKREWCKALRSKDFEQGRDTLLKGGKHCCLGVLCELAIEAGLGIQKSKVFRDIFIFDNSETALPDIVVAWAGLDSEDPIVDGTNLANRNDDLLETFDEIADLIEKHL